MKRLFFALWPNNKTRKQIDMQPIEWQAQSFCLVESLSTPKGVHYQVLQHWSFK